MVSVNFQHVRLAQQPRKLGLATSRQDFIISYKVSMSCNKSIFQFFFKLKSYSSVLELFGIKELDLSDTNQQRRSTEL